MANINVKVNADTSTAKQALQDLQRQLDQLSNPTKLTSSNMSSELMKAAQAAEILKTQLEQATNVNTGRLDLTKFTQQLSQSGMSLEKYQQYFKQFGAQGQKAFATLASSIAQAEIPLKNMNSMTQKMWTSIKNTINWQISSSLIHGIVGQFSTMVNYAKDLDKSLNNIQIVTGASAQKMTQFAQQANQAAKQLNTTTTAYTNASLIYYQQGLSDKEVKARTDVTVKLANVTKESVTDVSNQLTAIWNNFAEGSGNLEHFADVITALGAATASSSKEIATGLEKFASIADTVGLSYEKATAALATVTAKTRQSADTVGTGFRTIFSRLQSLSLGETLDDGVNLTKYTKALKTIGVQALDTSGNLRSMDNIIMDVGKKWEKLTDSQKMAFANTVGGVRQYATLVALFDDFDQFKANLSIAETSDGTLQNQADIYAESWEAAGKRVRATAEGIYGRLVNSDDMASLMDTFSGFLEMIQGIIDGLGGLKGVLATLGAIATTVFSKQISTGLENMGMSLMTMTRAGRNYLTEFQKNAINTGISHFGQANNERDAALVRSYKNQQADNLAYLTYGSRLNESQQAQMRGLMDFNRGLYTKAEEAGAEAFTAKADYQALRHHEREEAYKQDQAAYEAKIKEAENKFLEDQKNHNTGKWTPVTGSWNKAYEAAKGNPELLAGFLRSHGNYLTDTAPKASSFKDLSAQDYSDLVGYGRGSALLDIMTKSKTARTEALGDWETMRAGIKERVGTYKDENGVEQINYQEFFKGLGELSAAAVKAAQALDTLKERSDSGDIPPSDTEGTGTPVPVKDVNENAQKLGEGLDTSGIKSQASTEAGKKVINTDTGVTTTAGAAALGRDKLLELLQQPKDLTGGQAISKIAGAATAAASAVMMLSNAFKVLGDDSATGSQKLGAAMSMIMGIGTALPAISGIVEAFGTKVVLMGGLIKTTFAEIFAVVAAVAAVGALIGYVISKTDTDEKQLKRATESARELQDNYKAAADYSKSLKDAFSNYDNIADTLNNCIKYSDEWYAALENVRSAVLDILQEFPELAQFGDALEWDEDLGGYKLNEDVRKQATEAAEQNELVAKAAALEGQNNLSKLQAQQQEKTALSTASKQAYKDIISSGKITYNENVGGENVPISLEMGTILSNWLSTLTVDQLQGLKANGFQSAFTEAIASSSQIQPFLNKYNEANHTNYTIASFLENIDAELTQFSDNYTKNGGIDELIEAQKQENLVNTAEFNRDRTIASGALADQGYSSVEMDMAARAYREYIDNEEELIKDILKKPGPGGLADNWGRLDKEFTKIVDEFIKLSNGKYTQAVLDDVISESGAQRYINLQTTSGTENVRIETIASTVAAQRALENLGDSAAMAQTKIETFDTNFKNTFGEKNKDGTLNSSMKNFMATMSLGNNITITDLKNLSGEITNAGGPEAFLMKMFGLTDETKDAFAKSLGYNNGFSEMVNQFNTSRTNANISNAQARSDLQKTVGDNSFLRAILPDLTTSQISSLTSLFTNINKYDPNTAKDLTTLLSAEGLSLDQIIAVIQALSNIDDSPAGIKELTNTLSTIFEGIPGLKDFDFSGFISKMQIIESAANGIKIDGFIQTMESIQTLLGGNPKAGTTISKKDRDEKYKNIDFSNIGYEDAAGNIVLIADSETIKQDLIRQNNNVLGTDSSQLANLATLEQNASNLPEFLPLNATKEAIFDIYKKYGYDPEIMWKTFEADFSPEKLGYSFYNSKTGEYTPYSDVKRQFPRGTLTTDAAKQNWILTAMANKGNAIIGDARYALTDEYNTAVQQIAEHLIGYDALSDFLYNQTGINGQKYGAILEGADIDVEALKERSILNYATMMGYDTATIQQTGAKYYNSGKPGLWGTYASLQDAEWAVVQEQDALKKAAELGLDTAKIQAEAQEAWANGSIEAENYSQALQKIADKEIEIYSFRQGLMQQASLANINYDEVIEYAKAIRAEDDALKSLGLSEADLIRESEEYALAQLKLKKSLDELKTATSTYHKELKKWANDEKADMDKVHQGLFKYQTILKDIFGGKAEDYTSDFIKNNLDLIEKAASGDEKAFRELGQARAEAIIEGMDNIDPDKRKNLIDTLQDLIAQDDVKVGVTLDFDQAKGNAFLSTLQSWVDNNQIDTSQMLDLAKAGGWEPVTKTVTVEDTVDDSMIQNGTVYTVGADGTVTPVKLDGKSHIQGDGASSYDVIVGWKKTGPGSGGGGGGGGGGKKAHKPKRYRNIENQVQNNNRKLESTTRKKDRSFGTAKLDALKEERKLHEENLKLQQQYQSEIEDWLGKDKTSMMDAFAKIGFKPIFDEFGEVINNDEFEALWEQAGEGAGEEWQEAADALDQYEETLDKYNDKLEEIKQIQEEIFDSFLEETQLEVEMKINVNTANIEYIDYLLGKIEDDAYQAAEAIALLGHKTGEIEIQASVYRKGINDILSHHTLDDGTQLSLENIGSMTTDQLLAAGFTDAEIQELQKYRSELLQLNQQLLEMRNTVADKVVDALEKMNEEIQKSYENFDHYNSVLEHYKNINDLINIGNTKMSKEIAGKLNRAMLSNAQNQVKSAREIYDAAKLNMQNAQAEYENALAVGDEQTAKYWKKIMDAASDQLKESENQWLEAWEGALEQAKAIFETAIQDIVDTYNEQMGSTFGSLDYLQAAYDRQKETNEQYLQDYDRLYELSKLSRDISKSIDDTDSIKGKQKLRDIQTEINKLQADGTKLSQYDIEALQKKYELEKARLALEDAQNAKQTVRLQRDSEGNWGYVYTADEDKVAEAEQEYEDKLHEYQKLNDEYIQELQDKALSAQATYRDLIQEIMSDTTLTDEQRQARLEEVQNWYNEQINFFGQQLTNALNNQEGTLDRYYQRYNDERAKLVDSWKETTLSLLTGTGSMDDYMAHMRESASQMVETAYQALLQYKQDIDQTDAMAGQDSSFSEMVGGVVSGIGELSTATEASISTLADTMTDEFATALQAAVNWESQYVSEMMQMIAQTEAEVTAVNNLIAALSGLDTTALYAAANATVGAAGAGQASTSAANAAEQAAKATAAYSTNPYYAFGEKKMTEDFLHIVNDNMIDCNIQLDDIIRILELQVNAFSEGLGALISAPGIMNEPQDILEQNIHIDVSFPNVTQHSEIEKAFENLVNKAAQYANRKN